MLFRMVPKLIDMVISLLAGFRAVLFRMVPKPCLMKGGGWLCFRAVLFRMVPKLFCFMMQM